MKFFLTFIAIVFVFACIFAVVWWITNVIMKWDAKRNAKESVGWNEAISLARQSRYWNPRRESQVEDVEYEDLSNEKLLERKL